MQKYECRAVTGSPNMFSSPNYYIPYILMEWILVKPSNIKDQVYSKACPRQMLMDMVHFLSASGYEPFKEATRTRLNIAQADTWTYSDIVWKHKDAEKIF